MLSYAFVTAMSYATGNLRLNSALALPAEAKGNLRLRVRSVPVVVANSDGYLYGDDLM